MASVISAPAALVVSKILVPQTENIDHSLQIDAERPGENLLDAICIGTWDGVRLAVNVAAMLLVFTTLVALANWILADGVGDWTGLNGLIALTTNGQYDRLTLEFVLGLVGTPIAWLIGMDAPHLPTSSPPANSWASARF